MMRSEFIFLTKILVLIKIYFANNENTLTNAITLVEAPYLSPTN